MRWMSEWREGSTWAEEVYGEGECVRGLDSTMDSEICNRYLLYWGSLKTIVHFGMQLSIIDSHLSLPPIIREITLLVEGNLIWLRKFLRNIGFCLTVRIWGNGVSYGSKSLLLSLTGILWLWHVQKIGTSSKIQASISQLHVMTTL
jgi:hypothetical protein